LSLITETAERISVLGIDSCQVGIYRGINVGVCIGVVILIGLAGIRHYKKYGDHDHYQHHDSNYQLF